MVPTGTTDEVNSGARNGGSPVWVLAALLIATATLAGSLWLSIGMGLKACPLCFYQRTFVMGVVAVLAIGLLTGRQHWNVLNVLALPLAVGGFGVAAFHVSLELSGKLECPAGVQGIGTAPQQSLAAFAVLLLLVGAGVVRSWSSMPSVRIASLAGIALGGLLTWGAVASAPPLPPAPKKPYETPMDMCRPPYHAQ